MTKPILPIEFLKATAQVGGFRTPDNLELGFNLTCQDAVHLLNKSGRGTLNHHCNCLHSEHLHRQFIEFAWA